MAGHLALLLLVILFGVGSSVAQTDSSGLQAVIPQSLIDCYRNQSLLTREYLPPMTLNALLAILRKLENLPGVYMDMRTMSAQILNTFRLDGIEKNPDVAATEYVTPYGPSGNSFYRYKILMDGLIPSNGNKFPATALTNEEKCALHFMLSVSVDRNERGDENTVCNSLTNYVRWDSRVPRDIRTYNEETEVMDHHQGDLEMGRWMEGGYTGLTCPLENGVVYTRYGAIKMGLVLGGIAAGLQSQSVSWRNLMVVAKANSLKGRSYNFPRMYASGVGPTYANISNIWAASLSGKLAEVALLQGPLSTHQIKVGMTGGWNDSVLPRYYFLNEDNKDAMTDSDIRGSIDGLTLGSQVQSWSSQVGGGGMKLSQLIDMYYSERGVLNSNIRACQRIDQFYSLFTMDQIFQQSYAFSGVLELELPPAVNVEDAGIRTFNSIAVSNLKQSIDSMKNRENQCSFSSSSSTGGISPGQATKLVKPGVHLYLVMDFSYEYLDAARIASQLVERLEVSKFTGNISIINARDASIVVNTTNNVLEMYANFSRSRYQTYQRGFDLSKIVSDVGNLLKARLNLDNQLNTAGGPASVVLIVPFTTAVVNDNDKSYILGRLYDLRQSAPDTRFMFLSPGSKEKFTQYVQDQSRDVFTLTLSDIPTSIDSVINRLKEIPRRIVNPTCTSNFWGSASSNLAHRTYIEPVGGVQYFRIHPNYFYKTSSGSIKFTSLSGRAINICQSRVNVMPGNSTQSDTCKQITSDTYEVYLNNACGDNSIMSCAPFYFSIAAVPSTSSAVTQCTDEYCRYPDNIPVDIRQDGLTCASGAMTMLRNTSVTLILFTLIAQLTSRGQPVL